MRPLACCAALVLGLLPAAALAVLPADPDKAFSAARDAWISAGYPRYAHYNVMVKYTLSGKPMSGTWETFEDLQRRVVRARAFSQEEAAHPHVATGVNVNLLFYTTNPEKPDDPLGMVTFAVNQDFGISRDLPSVSATGDATSVDGPTHVLKQIGHTGVEARTYTVTLAGAETLDGHAVTHLKLAPIKDPKRFRLRELWLDDASALPLRAIVAGIGNAGPWEDVNWQVDWTIVDGEPYLAKETALAALDTDDGTATDVTITFGSLTTMHYADTLDRIGYSREKGTTDP